MSLKSKLLSVACLILMSGAAVASDVTTSARIGSGYRGNLFDDSSTLGDAYGAVGVNVQYYPTGFAQLSGEVHYHAYSTYTDLSNLTTQISATVIPTKESSRFSLMLSGSGAIKRFGPLYQLYDQNGLTIGSDLSYRVAPTFYLLGSATFANSTYVNSDFGSSSGYDLSLGASTTLFDSNTLSVSAQYTDRVYDQPAVTTSGTGPGQAQNAGNDPSFQIVGATVRYSRPLGKRTGLNLSVARRVVEMDDDLVLYGYSIDYLSPWADLWEGNSVSIGLKHFFPRQWLAEITAGCYDKEFSPIVDADESGSLTYWTENRADQLTSAALSITRPITLHSGKQLTFSLSAGYRRNTSTIAYYDYNDIWTSLSINMTL